MIPSYIDARSFNIVADNTTNYNTELQSFFNACITQNKPGLLPPGLCFSDGPLELDLSQTNTGTPGEGVVIDGSGLLISGIRFANDVTTPFKVKSTTGNNTFGWSLSNLSILGNSNTPILQIGEDNFSDEHNNFNLKVWVINYNTQSNAVGVKLNAVFNADLDIVSNCGGASTGKAAAEFNAVQFSRVKGSFGNSSVGLRITNWYNYGNVFNTLNLEESDINLVIDSPHSNRNTFIGGTFNWNTAAINATAGSQNRFIGTNWAAASPPTMINNVGIIIDEFV